MHPRRRLPPQRIGALDVRGWTGDGVLTIRGGQLRSHLMAASGSTEASQPPVDGGGNGFTRALWIWSCFP